MRNFLLTLMLCISFNCFAPSARSITLIMPETINPYTRILRAISDTESAGDTSAYNEKENAIGCLQIRSVMVLDHFFRTGEIISHEDCYDEDVSKKIFFAFASQYHFNDYERIARCWNGGARGMSKDSTVKYWEKVKHLL